MGVTGVGVGVCALAPERVVTEPASATKNNNTTHARIAGGMVYVQRYRCEICSVCASGDMRVKRFVT